VTIALGGGKQSDGGGFAGAVGAEKPEYFPRLHEKSRPSRTSLPAKDLLTLMKRSAVMSASLP
jgi:hypothetical protein